MPCRTAPCLDVFSLEFGGTLDTCERRHQWLVRDLRHQRRSQRETIDRALLMRHHVYRVCHEGAGLAVHNYVHVSACMPPDSRPRFRPDRTASAAFRGTWR